jgi:hypothetical protein
VLQVEINKEIDKKLNGFMQFAEENGAYNIYQPH